VVDAFAAAREELGDRRLGIGRLEQLDVRAPDLQEDDPHPVGPDRLRGPGRMIREQGPPRECRVEGGHRDPHVVELHG
jgi:hypothetical protein